MKICGIIAEYNPFHSGHAYQIARARKLSGCDYIIAVMSGDFVQRGAPALMEKYSRARMALAEGADLVLMLPVYGSTASAEGFARAGVSALLTTGVVDAISFGCENPSICSDSYRHLAKELAHESADFTAALGKHLAKGMPYAQARIEAVRACYGSDFDLSLLDTPNNMLTFEYMRALDYFGAELELVPVRRLGNYHDVRKISSMQTTASSHSENMHSKISANRSASPLITSLTDDPPAQKDGLSISGEISFASASACRKAILSDFSREFQTLDRARQIPPEVCRLLADYAANYPFLQEDDLSLPLHYALLARKPLGYGSFLDCGADLSARISNCLEAYQSVSGFCDLLKNKSVTHARIARALTHILLQLPAAMPAPLVSDRGTLPYLRVLGFRQASAPLLHEIRQRAKSPLITRVPEAERMLSADALQYFRQDLFASEVYRSVILHKCGHCYPDDYRRRIEIV
ncbi:MAG: nucleotidyltransferase family protein [Lachnospiraceae bacterium]|nr:nucleotidyltransferase family protein [bacterium]MDY5517369.1 nucleotidyltransferase family protein [Lachnospiraceae bacterium]